MNRFFFRISKNIFQEQNKFCWTKCKMKEKCNFSHGTEIFNAGEKLG